MRPIDPLAIARVSDLKLEVSEKLPQGLKGEVPVARPNRWVGGSHSRLVRPVVNGETGQRATRLVAGKSRQAVGTKRSGVTPRREGLL